jgi:hypothetical protein
MKILKLILVTFILVQTFSASLRAQTTYFLIGREYPEKKSKPVISQPIDTRGCNGNLNLEAQFIDQYNKENPRDIPGLHSIEVLGPFSYNEAEGKRHKMAVDLYNKSEYGLTTVQFLRFKCDYKSHTNQEFESEEKSGKSKAGAGITIERKDASFQEAEAKRILEAKKAAVQREIRLQALKNKSQAEDKERIRLMIEAQKKRGRRQ